MYLTKLELNIQNKSVLHNMSNCEWVHKLILEKGFGHIQAENVRQTLKILYAVDGMKIYVQSATKPEFDNCSYWISRPVTICIDAMKNICRTGMAVRFKCTCNPTKKLVDGGKRIFLSSEKERDEWIKRVMERSGAEVLIESQTPDFTVWGMKKDKKTDKSHEIYAKAVTYSGALKITDEEKFWEAFCNGIGREKAYGCGMLMLHK